MGITNRVALVTGAAGGMGKYTAKVLAQHGAKVAINDIVPEALEQTVNEFKAAGYEAMGCVADVMNREAVQKMCKDVVDRFGSLDILVNNAGLEKAGPLRNLTEADWDLTLNVNLKGAFLCSQAAHGYMVERKHGRIINISSRAWFGGPGQAPYSSAKAGMVGLTRTLALELGRSGIMTNCVAPGLIHTPMWDALPEKNKAFLLTKLPGGKLGDADDVANTVLFFADDECRFVNGQVLYVCGGRSLFSG